MTYVVVIARQTVASRPFTCYASAFSEAARRFGDDATVWIRHNVRVEESRADRPSRERGH